VDPKHCLEGYHLPRGVIAEIPFLFPISVTIVIAIAVVTSILAGAPANHSLSVIHFVSGLYYCSESDGLYTVEERLSKKVFFLSDLLTTRFSIYSLLFQSICGLRHQIEKVPKGNNKHFQPLKQYSQVQKY
jgi:hypothetical protein